MWEAIAIIGSAVIGGLISSRGQGQANDTNAAQAEENRRFQERMSSTSHQREVGDLQAAGLNPLLSANSGASTPTGAQAVMQNANESAAASGREVAQLAMNMKKQQSDIELQDKQKLLTDAQIKSTDATTLKTNVDAEVARKGIPGSEMKNYFYDKIKQGFQSGVKSFNEMRSNDQKEYQKIMTPQPQFPLKGGLR